jgi:hypothetical protein
MEVTSGDVYATTKIRWPMTNHWYGTTLEVQSVTLSLR